MCGHWEQIHIVSNKTQNLKTCYSLTLSFVIVEQLTVTSSLRLEKGGNGVIDFRFGTSSG